MLPTAPLPLCTHEPTHRSLDERGPVELVGGLLVARAGGVDLVPREGLLLGFLRAAALAVCGRPGRREFSKGLSKEVLVSN